MTAHLTTDQRALAHRLRAGGMSLRDIAKEIGCSHSGIDVMLRGQAREELSPNEWCTSPGAESGSTKNDVHRVNLKMQF